MSFACGDFQIKATDGSILCGRSMEFPIPQESQVITFNRGDHFESCAPDGTKGVEWTNKYGFVGMNAFHLNRVDEGLNEKGLSFGVLTLEETVYQDVPNGQENKALAMMDVGNWILGNFATVAEVGEAIENVFIWGQEVKALGRVPGLHVALHDAEGNNAVIEIINGQMQFTENPNGVLTNDPRLENQLYSYKNGCWKNYTPEHASVQPWSIPGDWSSTTRFGKLATMIKCAKPENKEQAFTAATKILNVTDLPIGCVTKKVDEMNLPETTLWATIKDLKHPAFYFRPHNDTTFRAVDLTKIRFDKGINHPRLDVQVEKPTIIDISNLVNEGAYWVKTPVVEVHFSEMKRVAIKDYAKDAFNFKVNEVAEKAIETKAEADQHDPVEQAVGQ